MTEYDEAVTLSQTLDLIGIEHWHLVQENPGSKENGKIKWGRIARLKKQGWKKGVPDYLVFLPAERCKYKKAVILWIELKKPRNRKKSGEFYAFGSDGITIYPEQEEFISKMNKVGNVEGRICFGADDAIAFVRSFIKTKALL
jgi:phosphoribosylpyrophosphate synthetase